MGGFDRRHVGSIIVHINSQCRHSYESRTLTGMCQSGPVPGCKRPCSAVKMDLDLALIIVSWILLVPNSNLWTQLVTLPYDNIYHV